MSDSPWSLARKNPASATGRAAGSEPTPRQRSTFWLAIIFCAALGTVASGFVWYARASWQAALGSATIRLHEANDDLRLAAQNSLSLYAGGFAYLAKQLSREEGSFNEGGFGINRLRRKLMEFRRAMPGLAVVTVLGQDGRIIASSGLARKVPPPDVFAVPTLHPLFERMQHQPNVLQFGHPVLSPLTHSLVIHLGLYVGAPNGNGFFLFGGLDMRRQTAFYRSFISASRRASGMAIGLEDASGYLIARWPYLGVKDVTRFLERPHGDAVRRAIAELSKRPERFFEGTLDAGARGTTYLGAIGSLDHYPLVAFTAMPKETVTRAWWRRIRIPLLSAAGAEAGLIGLMLLALRVQRRWAAEAAEQMSHQVRLTRFNAMLAAVSEIIAKAKSEAGLFQAICEIVVCQCPMKLAFIARPDAAEMFEFVAAAGEISYLDGIRISTSPHVAEGRGPAGMTWRSGQPMFIQSFRMSEHLRPWRERAHHLGINAIAVLPLRRSGGLDALLFVYHAEENIFDDALRALLNALGQNISHGLDRLSLIAAERRALTLSNVMLDNSAVGVLLTRAGVIAHVNDRLAADLCWRHAQDLVGRRMAELHEDCGDRQRPDEGIEAALVAGREVTYEARLARLGQPPIWAEIIGRRVEGEDFDTVWVVQDITLRRATEHRLEYLASHDSLTGLPNRRAVEQMLPDAVVRAENEKTALALGVLDLDEFKPVNDRHGHGAGDALLRELAHRLRRLLREHDILARFGGDEFIVLIQGLDPKRVADELPPILERLHHAVGSPFALDSGKMVEVGISAGFAIYPHNGTEPETLMRLADMALYRAKSLKRTRLRWWFLADDDGGWQAGSVSVEPYGPGVTRLHERLPPRQQRTAS